MDPFRLPKSIGRYQVLSRLGKGAMGVVFSARDERMGRDVAIKIMNTGLDDEPDTRARFFREAQVTSKLLHRNIVTVFDLGEEAGRPFMVMELLKGRTLHQALKESALQTIETKLDLMIQLCEGLAKAHAAGVIHRDVKPSNLFILGDGSLKILDFGVARLLSSSMTQTGLVVGTPDYMSPEQARGGEVDERADVFSSAAVFYYMLTGRKPFAGPDVASSLRKVIQEDPEPMSAEEAPAPLARIITRALSKDPASRYQRCVEMAADLIRFKRNFDTETRQLGTTAKAQFDEALKAARTIRAFVETDGEAVPEWVDALQKRLEEQFPFFVTPTIGHAPAAVPFRRMRLAQVQTELQAALDQFNGELRRLEEERAKRTQRIEELYSLTERAVQAGELDKTDALLGEAARVGMAPERLQHLATIITDARIVENTLATARDECGRGAWDDAIARLRQVVDRRPDYTAVKAELVRVEAEHARLVEIAAREREAAQRQRQAAERAADAERLLNLGDYTAAMQSADEALELIPDQPDAHRIRAAALALLEQQAQAAIVAARARSHMAKAVRHLAAGRFDDATAEAELARGLLPESQRMQTVSSEAIRLRDANETSRRRSREAQDREREVTRLVESARRLLASGQQGPALHTAEQAEALDPSHEAARQTVDHIRSVISLLSDDEEGTLTLSPAEPEVQAPSAAPAQAAHAHAAVASGQATGVGWAIKDVGRRLAGRFKSRRP
jgi:predicted Ser/Thr protein kinase/tetratricopeptide (TPR) repeat protein